MSIDPNEVDAGHEFAERLYGLVHEFGPGRMTGAEKDAMAEHLLEAGKAWVIAQYASRLQ